MMRSGIWCVATLRLQVAIAVLLVLSGSRMAAALPGLGADETG